MHVSRNVPQEWALWGLLHDAAEAYSADVPRPLKRELTEWAPIESRIMAAVCQRFGLQLTEPPDVKRVDAALLSDERSAMMRPCEREWGYCPPGLGIGIEAWSPESAKARFLARFEQLTRLEVAA